MEIQRLRQALRRSWLVIALIAALGGLLALGYSISQPRVYEATATNFVAVGGLAPGTSDGWAGGSSFALQRVKSYVPVIDSPEVLQPVIDDLDLTTSPGDLAEAVSAANPPGTVLLNITATDGDGTQAAAIANAVAASYGHRIEVLETPAGSPTSPVKVTTVTKASGSSHPLSPPALKLAIIGLVLGLGVGVAVALIRDRADKSIRTGAALEAATGAVEFALVPDDPAAGDSPLVDFATGSMRGEAIRTLRTNLRHFDSAQPPAVVTVASTMPGDGKTTTACNLALALSETGSSVCIVEADLRRPRVPGYFGVPNDAGLTDVIAGTRTLDQVLASVPGRNVTVLPSGRVSQRSSELLASGQMHAVIEDLRTRFDAVLIDAAPLLPVTDGALVASLSDGVLLVARYGVTTLAQATKAAEALIRADAQLIGVVLNRVPLDKGAPEASYGGLARRA